MDLDHISHEELSNAMGRSVQSCTMEPLQGRSRGNLAEGYMADVFRLSLMIDREPHSLIMKVASSDSERRDIAERFGSYRNEQRFYRELNDGLPFRVPRCYYNASDRFLLLLEDLGDEGTVDTLQGASLEQAKQAIRTLAQIHAHFHRHPPEGNQPITTGLTSASTDMKTFVLDGLMTMTWANSSALALARHYTAHSTDFTHLFQQQNQVFTHLDFRLDNLKFLDEVVVLDWGESTRAPAGFDLASFLTSSITVNNRRDWEQPLLALYKDVRADIDEAFTPDRIFDEYRLALLPALYLPGLVAAHGDREEGKELLARNLAAIEDHDSFIRFSTKPLVQPIPEGTF